MAHFVKRSHVDMTDYVEYKFSVSEHWKSLPLPGHPIT